MNGIARLRVQGYRSIKDVSLEFGSMNVVIGANGSGKSNLLSFLRLLPLLRTRSLRRFVADLGGADALLFRGGKITPELVAEVELHAPRGRLRYDLRLARTQADGLVFAEEGVSERGEDGGWSRTALGVGHPESLLEEMASHPEASPALRGVRQALSRIGFYHFHDTSPAAALRSAGRAHDHWYLRSDGSNLAPYLLALRQSESHRSAWRLLGGLVRRIAPFIKELVPTPVNADPETFRFDDPQGGADRVSVRLDWLDEHDERYGVHQLSDGTVRAIALFAALTQPSDRLPAVISIDEPELGLHPAALTLLVGLLRSVAPRCQVFLATQSTDLLDRFEAEEILVAERAAGSTAFTRLDPGALAGWSVGLAERRGAADV